MFDLRIHYPDRVEEEKIATLTQEVQDIPIEPVVHGSEIIELQQLTRRIPVPPSIVGYAVRLARSTRPGGEEQADVAKAVHQLGARGRAPRSTSCWGPRRGRPSGGAPVPTMQDIHDIAPSILAHRIVINFDGEAEGLSTRDVITELLSESRKWI